VADKDGSLGFAHNEMAYFDRREHVLEKIVVVAVAVVAAAAGIPAVPDAVGIHHSAAVVGPHLSMHLHECAVSALQTEKLDPLESPEAAGSSRQNHFHHDY